MSDSTTLTWREVVDKYHSCLVDELTLTLDSAFHVERVKAAAENDRIRVAAAESLNQLVRRLSQAESEEALFDLLAEATAGYADRVVVLTLENNQAEARAAARRGIDEQELTFGIAGAAAITATIESKDPITSLASPPEIPAALAAAFAGGEGKLYLLPLLVRQDVVAMLVASGGVLPGALELICGAAGLKLELLRPPMPVLKALPSSELVQIEEPSVRPNGASRRPGSWADLGPDEQKLHLQAQRVARVKVAEMRLYHADDLRKGVAASDVYGALREQIDSARVNFRQSFLAQSATMVDYLHLELLRSLAHDDDRLLGEAYPGPMA